MRIIAGSLKGRRLHAPDWDGLRPTSDRLRETLFNLLAPRIGGARVLDVYAGTGAVGLEALSRGASWVTFIERDRRALALIEDNLARCGIANGYAIIRAEAAAALARLVDAAAERFDVVLLDPPYAAPFEPVLAAAAAVLTGEAVAVVEHARRREVPAAVGPLVRTRAVGAGDSALSFYQQRS